VVCGDERRVQQLDELIEEGCARRSIRGIREHWRTKKQEKTDESDTLKLMT